MARSSALRAAFASGEPPELSGDLAGIKYGVPMTGRRGDVFVNGVRSPTFEAGPEGDSDAAVFVHGNPGSTHDWERLVEAVGEHGRALALDMPGFGDADKPDAFPYTVEGYAAHLDDALRQLGVERAHIVLHDFGGPWGLQWAADNPERHGSTTLINTGVLFGWRWHLFARIWRTRGLGELFFATATRGVVRAALRRGQPNPLPEEALDLFYRSNKDKGVQRAVLRLYRASPADFTEPLAEPLRANPRPALVVWGAHDPYIDVKYAEQQRQTFPGATVVILEESGHWPMWDAPEEVAAAVVPFLARQLAGETNPAPAQEPS
jgi:pimeloyl-ACP methyl ester carboxylesterase